MPKFLIPTSGADDWRGFLASPSKQWKTGFSAKTLAHCWESARGVPESVLNVFDASEYGRIQNLEFIFGLPEHQTPLPGGKTPSQSDIFVLARSNHGLVSMTVEGKVNEGFGQSTAKWLEDASPGKRERLASLCKRLRRAPARMNNISYQLLHRTASALIEAERLNASTAIMLVHSFSQTHSDFQDYQAFIGLWGKRAKPNSVTYIGRRNGIQLYTAWVVGEAEFLTA